MTRLLRDALLVGALVIGAAAPAHAQGGLLKKIGEKASAAKEAAKRGVQEAAGEKTAAAAPAAASGTSGGAARAVASTDQPAKPRTVAFTDNVVEITDARLTALLAGMDAEEQARPQLEKEQAAAMAKYEEYSRNYSAMIAEYDEQRRAWNQKEADHERCLADVGNKLTAAESGDAETAAYMKKAEATMNDEEKMEAMQKRLEALAERMQAAQARGDQKAMMAINDTIQRVLKPITEMGMQGMAASNRSTARNDKAIAEAKQKCGVLGPEPKSPKSPSEMYPTEIMNRRAAIGAKAANMQQAQYAVLRERVEAYVKAKGRFGRYTNWAYTANEIAALNARLDGLMGHAGWEDKRWRVDAGN